MPHVLAFLATSSQACQLTAKTVTLFFTFSSHVSIMYASSSLVGLLLGASAVLAVPAPAPTPAPALPEVEGALEKRAACTFAGATGYSAASKSKASCATIVLSALTVPSGVTLDLTGLTSGTEVSILLFVFRRAIFLSQLRLDR